MDELQKKISQLDPDRMPVHVAMIMDGNGRWAKRQGFARSDGHAEGVSTVHRVTKLSSDLGVKYLTLMPSRRRIGTVRQMRSTR